MTKTPQDRREPGREVVNLTHGVSPSRWRQRLRRGQWYGCRVAIWSSSVQDGFAGRVRHRAAKIVARGSAAHTRPPTRLCGWSNYTRLARVWVWQSTSEHAATLHPGISGGVREKWTLRPGIVTTLRSRQRRFSLECEQ